MVEESFGADEEIIAVRFDPANDVRKCVEKVAEEEDL